MGFSKGASSIGILLAIDNLTSTKSCITFACIWVQINPLSVLQNSIAINLNVIKFQQQIVYDWKPKSCHICVSISYENSSCHLHPSKIPIIRGRIYSKQSCGPPKPTIHPLSIPPKDTSLNPELIPPFKELQPTHIHDLNTHSISTVGGWDRNFFLNS